MITDPISDVNKHINYASVLRGFSHGSRSRGLRTFQNYPLLYGSTAREGSRASEHCVVHSFRLSLTLPCTSTGSVVQ